MADGEALDHPHAADPRVGQPSLEGGADVRLGLCPAAVSANDPAEPEAEIDDLSRLVILQHMRDRTGVLSIEIPRLAKGMPRQLLR